MPGQKFEKILKGPYCDGPQKRQRQTQGCPTEHRFAKLHVHYAQGKKETRHFLVLPAAQRLSHMVA